MGNAQFNYEQELDKCRTLEDVTGKDGLVQRLVKNAIETMLKKELTEYLEREKSQSDDGSVPNSRNGTSPKTIKTNMGDVRIDVPRDRKCEFEPEVIKKHETISDGLESKVISMYSKGMSTRDIRDYIHGIYGTEISHNTISNITDKVMVEGNEWFTRPLCKVYPVIFMDAVHYKCRTEGHVQNRAAYVCLGVNQDGYKEVLGIWIGENEGAKFWLGVCNELKNRGVEDILISCINGLSGFPDAIQAAFPKTEIQLCIIHQVRNTIKYVANKDQKEFIRDLKPVYRAPSEEAGLQELDNLSRKWGKKYGVVIESWLNKWGELATFFKYPPEIRRVIYTTNTLEGFNRQLRKATKVKTIFPSDDALKKSLYLATIDITRKWTMPAQDWGQSITQFAVFFEKRLNLGV